MNKELNNQSMATVVETFFIEETVDLIHDNDALGKWNERVEELSLKGQQQIVVSEKSPIPFLWMNEALVHCFETLCPAKQDIKEYDKTPIPVELLNIVSLCVKEEYFWKIQVWYNDKAPDPVIVGYKIDPQNSSNDGWSKDYYSKKYLIGRWADVKVSLDALMQRAKKVFISQSKIALSQQIKQAQRQMEDIEEIAEQRFGNSIPVTPNLPF